MLWSTNDTDRTFEVFSRAAKLQEATHATAEAFDAAVNEEEAKRAAVVAKCLHLSLTHREPGQRGDSLRSIIVPFEKTEGLLPQVGIRVGAQVKKGANLTTKPISHAGIYSIFAECIYAPNGAYVEPAHLWQPREERDAAGIVTAKISVTMDNIADTRNPDPKNAIRTISDLIGMEYAAGMFSLSQAIRTGMPLSPDDPLRTIPNTAAQF
jgi:hypothetical protein